MALRLRSKWALLFGEPTGPGWGANRPCQEEVKTASGVHPCKERGDHWEHTCVDPDCGFRWAR